jgi:hypothetical protein
MKTLSDPKYGWIGTKEKELKTERTSRCIGVHTSRSKGVSTSSGDDKNQARQPQETSDSILGNARTLKKRTFYIEPECSRNIKILSAQLGVHEYVLMNEAISDLLVKYDPKEVNNEVKSKS